MINKKELINEYKRTIQPMGVLCLKNISNGKLFIISAKDLKGKINSIKFQLEHGSYINAGLQKDYKLFGTENFSFEILDTLEPKEDDPSFDYTNDLKMLEELWIEKLKPFGDAGYNTKK